MRLRELLSHHLGNSVQDNHPTERVSDYRDWQWDKYGNRSATKGTSISPPPRLREHCRRQKEQEGAGPRGGEFQNNGLWV